MYHLVYTEGRPLNSILTLVPAKSKQIKEAADRYFHKDEIFLYQAENKQALFDILSKELIDLVLISNRNIPDGEMVDIMRAIRTRIANTAVVVITPQDERELAMKLYNLGMDDWIKDPYDALEICMRCRAVLRRVKDHGGLNISIGNVTVDYDRFETKIDGETVHLPKKEFLLFHLLLSNPDKVFTKSQLMEYAWGYNCESDEATIAVHIGRIKKRIGDNHSFDIVSVRGVGYRAVIK